MSWMRFAFIIFLILPFLSESLTAQENSSREIRLNNSDVRDSAGVVKRSYRGVSLALKGGISGSGYYDIDKFGGRAGLSMEIPVGRKFSLQSSLFYVSKGGKLDQSMTFSIGQEEEHYNKSNYDITSNYIEFQLQGLFNIPFRRPGFGMQLAIGPYIAYGTDGNTSHTVNKDGVITKTRMSTFGESGMDHNRFDAGIAYEINFVFGHFLVGSYIEAGVTDVYKTVDTGNYFVDTFFNRRNLSVGIGVGYRV